MPATIPKLLATLANWLLVALLVGGTIFGILLVQNPTVQQLAAAMLALAAFYFIFLLPALLGLAIGLLLIAPCFCLLLWLVRRSNRKQAACNAYQQMQQLYKQFPTPVTPHQAKYIPLMQRRFKH